ncbi:MAG: hypothetical protein M0033_12260 [Nitrospiraceae bacterium]|nr:hypothetical protein [Nitrospiraceae bacterium]
MKVIISHDIDHITPFEHLGDLILPKFAVRSAIELMLGRITPREISRRGKGILENRWHNIAALMDFDWQSGVPSTFFIGVSKGRGLSYSPEDVEHWCKVISMRGFDLSVHGISFDDFSRIRTERETFSVLTGLGDFGIRMHYLRLNPGTLAYLERAGYSYDSSVYEMKEPFREGRLWEFPLHIMDSRIFCGHARWQARTLREAKYFTQKLIDDISRRGMNYLTILFHDLYFCDSYRSWKEWYIWLIGYLLDNKLKCISYAGAIRELEGLSEI